MARKSTAVVSKKGWIVIPQEIREEYGLKPGTRVQIVDYAGTLAIVRVPEDPIAALAGMVKGGPSLTQLLLEERRRDREREDAR